MRVPDLQPFIGHLLAGERDLAGSLALEAMRGGRSVIDVYEDLFRPALVEIGRMWADQRICSAEEHLATETVQFLMRYLHLVPLRPDMRGGTVIIAAVEGEQHHVGANMAADAFTLHGWDTKYLGPNTPSNALAPVLRRFQPKIVAFSATMPEYYRSLLEATRVTRSELGDDVIIVAGGAACGEGSVPAINYCFADLRALNDWIASR
jgi:methanogenic corrinoid protein MtbC1